jgi:hypothetical protein
MTNHTRLFELKQNLEPQATEIVKKLFDVINSVDNRLTSDIKWRQLTFALEGNYHHWICAIAVTKKSVNLVFHFGGLLDDPNKILIAAASKFFRKIEFQSVDNIDEKQIKKLIFQAIDKLPYFKENWKTLNK